MAELIATNLSKEYPQKSALKDVNLHINKGKIYTIIGPNGSGKSTLLKLLTRQMKPTTGEIFLGEKDINSYSVKELSKKIALLSQHVPEVDLTVKDLVSYGRAPYQKMFFSRTEEADKKAIHFALKETNLLDYEEKLVQNLSGGERQRAWIALALAQEPEVLFLDEPTTYLDIEHQLEVMEVVKRLNEDHGVTIIMILHDLNHAATYSDEIIVLQSGSVYATGEPREVMTTKMFVDVFNVHAKALVDEEDGSIMYSLKGLVT